MALKIKHSPAPNSSYGSERLDQHFVIRQAYAVELMAALDRTPAEMPAGLLNMMTGKAGSTTGVLKSWVKPLCQRLICGLNCG